MTPIGKGASGVSLPATYESSAAATDAEWSARYEGWRVVLAAHWGAMVSFGSLLVFTFSVFLKPLAAEFHWSREEVSRAFAIAAMTVAVVSPFLGYALDRWGPRAVVLPSMGLFAAGIFALGRQSGSLAEFYAIFLLIGLAGNGTTQMGYSGAVSSWFTARRGLAVACVVAGVGIGSIVHPILAERLIATYGWRTAYTVLGTLVLIFGIPTTALWVRRNPADRASARTAARIASARRSLGHREFWLLVAVLFLSSISANGALTHLAAHLSDRGVSAAEAALAAGILGGANLVGRLGTGWLLDRIFGPRLSMVLLLIMAGGLLLLSMASSLTVAAFAVILIGLGLGGEADVTPFLIARYFGLESFSTLYGITWTFYACAGAIGPIVFGRVFDAAGTYSSVLYVASGLTLLSALLMLAMRRYPQH